jgi:hypothetical protein
LSNLVNVLQFALDINGLGLNKEKSMTYWNQKQSCKQSAWIEKFKWRWAFNDELSKMFNMPFGIGLDGKKVDTFFIEKIHTKLKFWNMVHLPIVGRAIIVNFVLTSTLWFFVNISRGTKKSIRKCKYLFKNFLWASGNQRTKTI